MRLWLLRPEEDLPENDSPWKYEYDCMFGFVIRAENEDHARQIANANGGFEVEVGKTGNRPKKYDPWLYEEYSSCIELEPEGRDGVVIEDYHAG